MSAEIILHDTKAPLPINIPTNEGTILPPEILNLIFWEVIKLCPDNQTISQVIHRLAGVCRRWRSILAEIMFKIPLDKTAERLISYNHVQNKTQIEYALTYLGLVNVFLLKQKKNPGDFSLMLTVNQQINPVRFSQFILFIMHSNASQLKSTVNFFRQILDAGGTYENAFNLFLYFIDNNVPINDFWLQLIRDFYDLFGANSNKHIESVLPYQKFIQSEPELKKGLFTLANSFPQGKTLSSFAISYLLFFYSLLAKKQGAEEGLATWQHIINLLCKNNVLVHLSHEYFTLSFDFNYLDSALDSIKFILNHFQIKETKEWPYFCRISTVCQYLKQQVADLPESQLLAFLQTWYSVNPQPTKPTEQLDKLAWVSLCQARDALAKYFPSAYHKEHILKLLLHVQEQNCPQVWIEGIVKFCQQHQPLTDEITNILSFVQKTLNKSKELNVDGVYHLLQGAYHASAKPNSTTFLPFSSPLTSPTNSSPDLPTLWSPIQRAKDILDILGDLIKPQNPPSPTHRISVRN